MVNFAEGSLSLALRPLVLERFANRNASAYPRLAPFVSFPPVWSDFGDVELHDDLDEVTIYFGTFAHVHVSCFDDQMTAEQQVAQIADRVLTYLDDTFADRLEFWKNRYGGGCMSLGGDPGWLGVRSATRRGMWSRQISATGCAVQSS